MGCRVACLLICAFRRLDIIPSSCCGQYSCGEEQTAQHILPAAQAELTLTLYCPLAAEYDMSNFDFLYLKILLMLDFSTTILVYLDNLIIFFFKQ